MNNRSGVCRIVCMMCSAARCTKPGSASLPVLKSTLTNAEELGDEHIPIIVCVFPDAV